MKVVLVLGLVLIFAMAANECPHDLQVQCIDDINKAYPVCQKAAQQKVKDAKADLECLKYFLSVQEVCWPCICWVAQQQKWSIKGCN